MSVLFVAYFVRKQDLRLAKVPHDDVITAGSMNTETDLFSFKLLSE